MKMRGLLIAGCMLLLSGAGLAQSGAWRNFTSMKDVRGIARSGNTFWAATSGGLFRWTQGSTTFDTYTSAEGLQSFDLTAVALDAAGNVWVGSSTGTIHAFSPSTGAFQVVSDIAITKRANKSIADLAVYGDTLLVSTDFGLSIFRTGKFEFGDTYTRFGTSSSASQFFVRSAVIFNGRLWASLTDRKTENPTYAVASASLQAPNLLSPEAWTLQSVPSTPGRLAVFGGTLYVATASGLYALLSGVWTPAGATGTSITSMAVSGTTLVMTTAASTVLALDSQGQLTQVGPATPYPPAAITLDGEGTPVIGSLGGGILTRTQQGWVSHLPNGPNSSQFSSVTIDPDGIVWGASGPSGGVGMYRYDGTSWTSFTHQNSPLPSNDVYRVTMGCNGSLWGATWGSGVVEIPAGGTRVDSTRVFGRNIGMVGLPNNPDFVVVSNTVCDGRGNVWMAVLNAANRNVLAVRTPNGAWRNMPLILNGSKMFSLFDAFVDRTLAVDGNDNLWIVSRESPNKGVIVMQNGGQIDSVSSTLVTTDHGLPSNEVRTVVIDRDNNVWVGTDKGIAIIIDASNPTGPNAIARYKPLNGLVINTIVIDPLNQKWVGTNEGVVLLSSDGTQQLASFTVTSTGGKLIQNDISSIAVDPKTGTVYFASASGLASLTTPAAAPKAEFDKLVIYPNPLRVPAARPLTVDGLVENSSLKVLTVDGRLVRDLTTPGGRIGFWDGKDTAGNDVASGIYLIVAYSPDGRTVNGKVAVIKR